MENYSDLYKRDFAPFAVVIGAIALLYTIGVYFISGIAEWTPIVTGADRWYLFGAAALLFTTFDIYGFTHNLHGNGDPTPTQIGAYRVTQTMFQIVLYLMLIPMGGIGVAAASIMLWWSGGCHMLFYFLGRHKFHWGIWDWLWWTPLGLVKVEMKPGVVIAQSLVGAMIAVVLMLLQLPFSAW